MVSQPSYYREVYVDRYIDRGGEGYVREYEDSWDDGSARVPAVEQQEREVAEVVVPQDEGDRGEGGPPVPDERTQELMTDGIQAFTDGKYETSAQLFLSAAMRDKGNLDAILAYAVARFATGDYSISADEIRRGIGLFPPAVDSVFNIRDRYGNQEDFEKHVRILEKYVSSHPDDVNGWLVLGFVRHFSHDRAMAAQAFEILKERSPKDAKLADVFLNARPLEEIMAALKEEMSSMEGQENQPQVE
ncbi:MAG: hypothetical protein JSV03_00955 [Planctomycetota bacterium]|nr:MAG: hypothetical protein JSV03_00955 [Planctomycetota bacterium]